MTSSRTLAAAFLACLAARSAVAQSIFTVAGGGTQEGRPATLIQLNHPAGIALDASGNLYIADSGARRLRKVAAGSSITTSVAGNGLAGFSGDGGPATAAAIAGPDGVAVDSEGNLFISVYARVRRIDAASGRITTIAGTGDLGNSGDGGPATAAKLFGPDELAVDRNGHLYIHDRLARNVRRVDATTGIITTVASTGPELLFRSSGVAVDPFGNLYFSADHIVRKIDAATGQIIAVAGTTEAGFEGDGGPATQARLVAPGALALDRAGNLYIADTSNYRIRRVSPDGVITTYAGNGSSTGGGDDGPATQASFNSLSGLAVDSRGDVYLADEGVRRVRRIDGTTGIITTFAGAPGECCFHYSGDDGPATNAEMERPIDVALDGSGNLYIGDYHNRRVRRVDARTGVITTAVKAAFMHVAVDAARNVFLSRYDDVRGRELHDIVRVSATDGKFTTIAGDANLSGFSGDGGPATAARLNRPQGLAFDAAGNLFIADRGNKRVRRVAGTGIITTVAGGGPDGTLGDGGPATMASVDSAIDVAVDASGNLYIASSNRIRKVDPGGTITTVAGGGSNPADGVPATNASVPFIQAIAVSASGDLFISQFTPYPPVISRVRRVSAANGIITTLAGRDDDGFSGDNGPASAALLDEPMGLAADPAGSLYIADSENDRVRLIPACTPLAIPRLAFPSDASSGVSLAPRLGWERVIAAARYEVLLDTVSPPKRVAVSDLAATSFSPSGLQPVTLYYWQTIAKGDPFCEPFETSVSPVRSFTTANLCSPPDRPVVP